MDNYVVENTREEIIRNCSQKKKGDQIKQQPSIAAGLRPSLSESVHA